MSKASVKPHLSKIIESYDFLGLQVKSQRRQRKRRVLCHARNTNRALGKHEPRSEMIKSYLKTKNFKFSNMKLVENNLI
jgi:hypothetical protein